MSVFSLPRRYGFLMQQLVARDFKTRYKRSVLGVVWSLLHPLLTTGVQYLVFSSLFGGRVGNYPLYLLSGTVCFNFFTEATGGALGAVVGNAPLITKVHVPLMIYPASRVLSATVNYLLALLPLLALAALTAALRPAAILLPWGGVFLAGFSLGVGLILASLMVFFRDTQFLWGVASMLWMYATPVFYPDSILPEPLRRALVLNPLWHMLRFVRTLLLEGAVPGTELWLMCAAWASAALLFGVYVFRRNETRFVFYL